jgi:hypothetical protein
MRISAAQEPEMNRIPTEGEIQRVMLETNMDYLQARRHLVQRYQIQADLQRNSPLYPLGKSSHEWREPEFCPFNTINS